MSTTSSSHLAPTRTPSHAPDPSTPSASWLSRYDCDHHTPVPYHTGWDLQRRIHADIVAGRRSHTVILVEHEPVYTVGRRTHSWERPGGDTVGPGKVPVVDVDRGGKTTWHGPGQLTVYPLVRLAKPIDVIRYVRALEGAVMDVCAVYGIETVRVEGRSGVWVPETPTKPERKICALGVRVARGVTMHGIGLNVDPDLAAFGLDRIIPCGIDDAGVTSLAAETGTSIATWEPAAGLVEALARHLAPLVSDATPAPPSA